MGCIHLTVAKNLLKGRSFEEHLGTNISVSRRYDRKMFLFPRWDMFVPWRLYTIYILYMYCTVYIYIHLDLIYIYRERERDLLVFCS